MHDVARRAGVALSTVSYAISGTRPFAADTRARIMAAMAELGYKPNALARGLASKRSRIIALLFPAREDGLGLSELEFVTSAANAATAHGYHLVLWSNALQQPADLRLALQEGLVEGVVVMEVSLHDPRIALLRELDVPFSMIGRCADVDRLGFVDVDFAQTTRDAVQYLASLGHTAIALLNHSQELYDAGYGLAVRAHAGFEQAARAHGVAATTLLCRDTAEAGFAACATLLAEHPAVTALAAMNDGALPGVLSALHAHGRRVPADFSIVSLVSSARVGQMFSPPLTTWSVPSAELGRIGVAQLITQLETTERDIRQELLPCTLVLGASAAARSLRPPLTRGAL
jgi:DNA-binding LacI/PurR family transcriptional regulator